MKECNILNTLRDYNKLHKIISNENGKEFFEMIRESEDLYMFFSIDSLCIWYKGLNVCTVGRDGIHSMTQSFKERADKFNPELKDIINNSSNRKKFSIYTNRICDIKTIVWNGGKSKQLERKNQQSIAWENRMLEDFHILDLEFAIPQEIAGSSKPEFDYLAVDTSKKVIYLIEYKCKYKSATVGKSNLIKHYEDMKKIKEHTSLIINTVADLWNLEKESIKIFSDYKIVPAFLFTDFNKFTQGEKNKINNILNGIKKEDYEIVIWDFPEAKSVDFSKEPIPIRDYKIS